MANYFKVCVVFIEDISLRTLCVTWRRELAHRSQRSATYLLACSACLFIVPKITSPVVASTAHSEPILPTLLINPEI